MSHIVNISGLKKSYGAFDALRGIDLTIEQGRIVGLIGSNGAGKTTLINAILGLTSYDGELNVMGLDPYRARDELMKETCFISDVAILPKWIKVSQVMDFVEGVHPRFNREKALKFLSETKVPLNKQVATLSKGMVVQLHLALIMAIDARFLVLDEPTLGLDILYRKKFYSQLLEDYFDEQKTILITTHQVEEIENILTDVIFIRDGQIIQNASMEEIHQSWLILDVKPDQLGMARNLSPYRETVSLGRTSLIYRGQDRALLEPLGDVRQLSLSDLFVTLMTGEDQ